MPYSTPPPRTAPASGAAHLRSSRSRTAEPLPTHIYRVVSTLQNGGYDRAPEAVHRQPGAMEHPPVDPLTGGEDGEQRLPHPPCGGEEKKQQQPFLRRRFPAGDGRYHRQAPS